MAPAARKLRLKRWKTFTQSHAEDRGATQNRQERRRADRVFII
jgi:hypothetical protein